MIVHPKLEVIAAIAFLSSADVLNLLEVLQRTIGLDPVIRERYVSFRYNNYVVSRHIGHLYLSAHTHGHPVTVEKINQALARYCEGF